jgi:two-component system, response regulator PdtaR
MSDPVAPVRILIAEDDANARAILVDTLVSLGHSVVAEVATGTDAVVQARAHHPDAVLLDVHMPDASGVDAAREIAAELPGTAVVLFTGDHSLTLSEDDVLATTAISMLAKPTPPNMLDSALRLAVARARALRSAQKEAGEAKQALENRKTIERAKGILMRRTGSSEQEAYRILQRTSQDRSVSMVEIARAVLESEPGYTPSVPRR